MDGYFLERLLLAGFRWQTRTAMKFSAGEAVPMPAPPRSGSAFLYVHVPFCEVLCPFCSFHRVQYQETEARRYFAALRQEIRLYHDAGFVFTGVYVGGGTPTVACGELLETLALIRGLFPVREISVETNPRDLRDGVLAQLAAAGVDRLSVGVQSFDDQLLRKMERYEKYGSSAEIQERLQAAAGLFRTLNADMIYNLPGQSLASLERDLAILLQLKVNQVSFYPLMTTKSAEFKMSQTMGLPQARRLRPYFDTILARLRPHFAPQSAWCFARGGGALDEYIVEADNYVGVGSGAFSYLDGVMYATTFSLAAYAERVGRGLTGITGQRRLSAVEQVMHALLVRLFGLRLEKSWFVERFGRRKLQTLAPMLASLKVAGALREDKTTYQLTDRGMYYWVLMMASFFESVNAFREQMRALVAAELDAD
jgi:coproporphyrinogen III oxidase-like Fe-S oxidoreductase